MNFRSIYEDSVVRSMERRVISKVKDKETDNNIFPVLELVRLTIPRRVYTNSYMEYTVESNIRLFGKRNLWEEKNYFRIKDDLRTIVSKVFSRTI